MSIINKTDETVVDLTTDRGGGWENRHVWLTSDGTLYADLGASLGDRENIHVFYNIEELSGDTTFAIADAEYENSSFAVTVPAPLDDSIQNLYVVEGASDIDGVSNVIYWAQQSGLTIIHEKQVAEANGRIP